MRSRSFATRGSASVRERTSPPKTTAAAGPPPITEAEEPSTAASLAPWHIRKVTETGLHLGGAIDTPSLCGRVQPPPKSNGWDLEVRITEHHLSHACPKCVEEYRKLCKHCGEVP